MTITLWLEGQRRVFEGASALTVVRTLMDEATFFEGESVRDYVEWVAGNIGSVKGARVALCSADADDETAAREFLDNLVALKLAATEGGHDAEAVD